MYYACFRVKRDKKDPNGPQKIIKKEFTTREDARAYLEANRDYSKYDQFWTE